MPTASQFIRDTDRAFYEEQLRPWLPERILDCHTHVCLDAHMGPVSPERRRKIWAIEAGIAQSWEELAASYRLLLPEQTVSVLAFGGIYREHDTEASNDYILAGLSDPSNSARGLYVTRPEWDAEAISDAMTRGFLGIKPYPDLVPSGDPEASIYDFLPRHHLDAVNELGGIVMLHLPRAGRIADPGNIRELLEISDDYPQITLIVAHIGRAFCLPTAEEGLPHFVGRPNIYFDTAANPNADALQYAIETLGPEKILFGSDMPITLMRGIREYHGNKYVNFTDAPYSWNTDRKSPEVEARYTFFVYEGLKAVIEASTRAGCTHAELRGILLENGEKLLDRVTTALSRPKPETPARAV